MSFQRLLDRVNEGGNYTINEIRDHFSPLVPFERKMEIVKRVHDSIEDLSEEERVVALLGALMMELI